MNKFEYRSFPEISYRDLMTRSLNVLCILHRSTVFLEPVIRSSNVQDFLKKIEESLHQFVSRINDSVDQLQIAVSRSPEEIIHARNADMATRTDINKEINHLQKADVDDIFAKLSVYASYQQTPTRMSLRAGSVEGTPKTRTRYFRIDQSGNRVEVSGPLSPSQNSPIRNHPVSGQTTIPRISSPIFGSSQKKPRISPPHSPVYFPLLSPLNRSPSRGGLPGVVGYAPPLSAPQGLFTGFLSALHLSLDLSDSTLLVSTSKQLLMYSVDKGLLTLVNTLAVEGRGVKALRNSGALVGGEGADALSLISGGPASMVSQVLPAEREPGQGRNRVAAEDQRGLWMKGGDMISIVSGIDLHVQHIHDFWKFNKESCSQVAAVLDQNSNKIAGIGRIRRYPNNIHTIHVFNGVDEVGIFDASELHDNIFGWHCLESSVDGNVFFVGASEKNSDTFGDAYLLALEFNEDAKTITNRRYGKDVGFHAIRSLRRHPHTDVLFLGCPGFVGVVLYSECQFFFISKINMPQKTDIIYDLIFYDNSLFCASNKQVFVFSFGEESRYKLVDNVKQQINCKTINPIVKLISLPNASNLYFKHSRIDKSSQFTNKPFKTLHRKKRDECVGKRPINRQV